MTHGMKMALADLLRWLADKLDPPKYHGSFGGTD